MSRGANQGLTYTLSSVTSTSTFSATTFVTATDRATNLTMAPFTVTRDTAPPTLTLSPAVVDGALRITWSSTDAASGVDASTCELRVQEDEGAWRPFSTDCTGDELHSAAQPGHVYTFRFSATDNVSNGATAEAVARFPRVTKYYYHGGQRVAMRADGVVYYLHGDHLGSTSLTTDASGAVVARQLYHPYGTVRHSDGTLPTDFGFGGQREDGSTGLVFMHARYYHAGLGRFTQADTIVPGAGNPQSLNRYSYVLGNPLRYVDPTGHFYVGNSGLPTPNYDGTGGTNNPHGPGLLAYRRGGGLSSIAPPIPVEQVRLSQWFGSTTYARDSGRDWSYDVYAQGLHSGIDLSTGAGTNVYAVADGVVDDIYCPRVDSCWIDVISGRYVIRYQHVTDYAHLKAGHRIGEEDYLASVYADHLHLEVRSRDESLIINPVLMLPGGYTNQLAISARDNARKGYTGVTYQYSDPETGQFQIAYLDPFNTMSIRRGPGDFRPPQTTYLNTFPYQQGW